MNLRMFFSNYNGEMDASATIDTALPKIKNDPKSKIIQNQKWPKIKNDPKSKMTKTKNDPN